MLTMLSIVGDIIPWNMRYMIIICLRNFINVVATFLVQFGAGLASVDNFEAGKALALSAAAAGLVALGKAIREYAKETNLYESLLKFLVF